MRGSRRAPGPVLVVDDDPSILFMVRELLEFEGYDVLTASDGEEALAAISRNLPAIVLLDMRMPRLDGWGVAAAVRDRGLEVPIVVVTAAESAQRWAQEIGADGYVAKPFDIAELVATVERYRRGSPERPA